MFKNEYLFIKLKKSILYNILYNTVYLKLYIYIYMYITHTYINSNYICMEYMCHGPLICLLTLGAENL